jgi:D-glycero-alpha-D-manno-heptose-7-phosphate kinase
VIISRTPVRISFVGGATDLPDFCDVHGGAVVSTTVDKWVHVLVAPRFEGDIRVAYSRTEIVDSAKHVQHELVREALRATGLPRGLDILTLADVPAHGTGLGSSSAVMVGLLNALYAYQGVYKSPIELAEEASRIEIEVLQKPIGRQDHFATALGGLNLIEFLPSGGGVRVEPLVCPPRTLERLHRSMLFFFTGKRRSSDDILRAQARGIAEGRSIEALKGMRDLAYELRAQLASGDHDIGALLHRNWELKRSLAEGVTTDDVDSWYERAVEAGATGGKLLGAGGGGFLFVLAPRERHAGVRNALAELREVPIQLAARGTQILFLDQDLS